MDQRPANTRTWQIEQMREENPDIWMLIDEFCNRGARLDQCLDDLLYPRYPCGNCGYDLYGNVSGVCPECGCPAEPTRQERTYRSCQIISKLRADYLEIWKQIDEVERGKREQKDRREAEERRERRERALQSYLQWRRELVRIQRERESL